MNPFAWLTRPPTPAESARALSLAGKAQERARVAATTSLLRTQGIVSPLRPRDEVVADPLPSRQRERAGA